jgi:hypothetical protein
LVSSHRTFQRTNAICALTNPSEICELRLVMKADAILLPVQGAAPAAAGVRAQAWLWWHDMQSAAARANRW